MIRRPLKLIDERLVRRPPQLRRLKLVFTPTNTHASTTSPPRPSSPEASQVDRLLGELGREFDLSSLVSGDRVAAKQLAEQFARRLVYAARSDRVESHVLRERIEEILPWLHRSLRVFADQLRLSLRSKT